MCIFCEKSPYQAPIEYTPSINEYNHSRLDIEKLYENCVAIEGKRFDYVDEKGVLQKYSLFQKIFNSNGDKLLVIKKIQNILETILNFNIQLELTYFHNTWFRKDHKYFVSYQYLAENILTNFSHQEFPEMWNLAHRIIHERAMEILVNERILHPDGTIESTSKYVRNNSKNSQNTSWAKTTVWNNS